MHKLTEKIKRIAFEKPSHHVEELDRIIREDREKMAKELTSKNWGHQTYPQFVRDILGLTDGGEVGDAYCNKCKKNLRDCKCPERSSAPYGEWGDAPEKPKQEWCEHTAIDKAGRYYYKKYAPFSMPKEATHCQFCGTPRPKELSLEERVANAIFQAQPVPMPWPQAIKCAQAAIEVMEKEMGK